MIRVIRESERGEAEGGDAAAALNPAALNCELPVLSGNSGELPPLPSSPSRSTGNDLGEEEKETTAERRPPANACVIVRVRERRGIPFFLVTRTLLF